MIDPSGILMVEPNGGAAEEALIDSLTRKITAAWRGATHSEHGYRGFHSCRCGVNSDNTDHWIDGKLTNSLCVHYVAFHRHQLSEDELSKVAALGHGEVVPTTDELRPPKIIK